MHTHQHTIQQAVSVSGRGLHTGKMVTMTFHPAPENHGYVFQRQDLDEHPKVKADVNNVVDTSRGTTIAENGAKIHTVEHTLAALAGLQIDNVLISLDGPEPPIMDGSALAFQQALISVGLKEQSAARVYFKIDEAICYEEPDRNVSVRIEPAEQFSANVVIDFDSEILPSQEASIPTLANFPDEFADSRTFCFLHELEALLAAGLIQGGSLENAVVIVERKLTDEEMQRLADLYGKPDLEIREGILNPAGLRHPNEPARHKLLDIVGDLALIGTPILGHVHAIRPGHKANIELAKKIKSKIRKKRITSKFQKVEKKGVIFDINAIQKILPHRYPFLLVDKIVEFNDKTIAGIKNVTINEPFFSGHFPGNPIMPGVLQLEAMAQVGGILLLNTIENPESVWVYIVAIDNARFKKPVIPGDTIRFELELLTLRKNICKMAGKGIVDGKVVCSADMIAGIVPKDES